EEELAGRGEALKGFSVAVDVFGKDADFDATSDPLVRVHAGRLRELLSVYYADEGKTDPIRISIPVGRYRPRFQGQAEPNSEQDHIADLTDRTEPNESGRLSAEVDALSKKIGQPSPVVKKQLKLIWLAFVLLGVLLAFFGYQYFYKDFELRKQAESSQIEQENIAERSFLPVIRIFTDIEDRELRHFGERLATALSNFDTITTLRLAPFEVMRRNANQWSKLEYAISLNKVGMGANGIGIVKVELISLSEGQILRAEEHPADIWEQSIARDLVARKVSAIATPEGVIYADILAKGEINPLLDCLIKVRSYYALGNSDTHKAAFECTRIIAGTEGSSGLVKAIHGGLIAEAVGKKYVYKDVSEVPDEALNSALILALKGVDEAPLSARSAREVGFIYSWKGEFDLMTEWFERANELNPNDTSIAASYGYGLVLTGNYSKAAIVLQGAIEATPRHPTWWDMYYSLALLMEGKIDEASDAIKPIGLAKRSLYYTMLDAVYASRKNQRVRSAYLARQLKERYPKFAANPQGSFEKRHFPKELVDTLLDGLKKSGL
ncbi:MAG: hypothetical protein WBC71_08935, partial [Salaquimonas sp.]